MCAATAKQSSLRFNSPLVLAFMVLAGTLTGLYQLPILLPLGHLISDIFVKLFQCISVPVISLSMIVTLLNYNTDSLMQHMWRRTLIYTLLTTLVAALISLCLYLLIQPAAMTAKAAVLTGAVHQGGYLDFISGLIPDNMLSPYLHHQVLSVLALSLAMGLAIRQIPDGQSRDVLARFFKGLHGMFMVMTRWIVSVIPLGLFGFISTTVSQLHGGNALKGMGQYLSVIVLANLIQGLIILPLWLRSRGIAPFVAMRAMMPALSLAFFSKSSVGTLPVTMNTIEKNMGVRPEVSRFVLPLCTSINMNGCAAFIFTTVIYMMHNQGIVLSLPMMLIWTLIATAAALGNAGVPMGCFFLSVSLLSSMNVSIALMGLVLPFYSLIDMLETALNVWSDACVAIAVDETAPTGVLLES